MAVITRRGEAMDTVGELPALHSEAPQFTLTDQDLNEFTLDDLAGRTLVLNIFPSIDTPTCARSVREFNQRLSESEGVEVLNISVDLPFAQTRFCAAEGLERVRNASAFRNPGFGLSYGVTLINGSRRGLFARAIVVLRDRQVIYTELVGELTEEPDYQAALAAAGAC